MEKIHKHTNISLLLSYRHIHICKAHYVMNWKLSNSLFFFFFFILFYKWRRERERERERGFLSIHKSFQVFSNVFRYFLPLTYILRRKFGSVCPSVRQKTDSVHQLLKGAQTISLSLSPFLSLSLSLFLSFSLSLKSTYICICCPLKRAIYLFLFLFTYSEWKR